VRIVVVGAGIIGTCVAYALAVSGAEVVLVEAGTPGGAASATSYAWLNSNSFEDPAYHALRVLGMSAYRDLAAELGTGDWLHQTGSVHVALRGSEAETLRARVARKQAVGYPAELLTLAEAARLEPALRRFPAEPAAVAYYSSEGYVDTTSLIGDLLVAFGAAGGAFVRSRAEALLTDGTGMAAGVRTSNGDLGADRVVLCTGADTGLPAEAGFRLSARGPIGATVITVPVPVRVSRLIHFPDLTVRPAGGGRLFLHADDIDQHADADAMRLGDAAAASLMGRARERLRLDEAGFDSAIAEVRVSYRPYPADGFPVVGPVPGATGAYLICTHSGVTLAAILARLVTREILAGTDEPMLAPYRPDRALGAMP